MLIVVVVVIYTTQNNGFFWVQLIRAECETCSVWRRF